MALKPPPEMPVERTAPASHKPLLTYGRPFRFSNSTATPTRNSSPLVIDYDGVPTADTSFTGIELPKALAPTSLPPPPRPAATEIAPPKPTAPVVVGGDVQAAKIIRKILPTYPALARQARVQGTVRLVGIIAKDGTVQKLRVDGGHPLLVPAAVDAVRQWIYRPTLLNGEPVEVVAPIDVHFTLQ